MIKKSRAEGRVRGVEWWSQWKWEAGGGGGERNNYVTLQDFVVNVERLYQIHFWAKGRNSCLCKS